MSEDSEYGFAVGRVRSIEGALLDRPRYDRLARAAGGAEFAAALAESGYARFLEGGTDVTQALDRAAAENIEFLVQYVPDRDAWLTDLFRLPGHFRVLKTGLKQALTASGDERQQAIKAVLADYSGTETERVRGAAVAAVAQYEQDSDPAGLDMALDRLAQDIALELTRPSSFLSGFYGLHADLENLRTFVRAKALAAAGDGGAEMRRAFLAGGRFTATLMGDLVAGPADSAVEQLAKAPPFGIGSELFFEYVEQGLTEAVEKRSMVRMERMGRELELQFLRLTRYATFGYEPLVTLFLFQENELRNLRQLHAAKVAGLPPVIVQELVAYVD